MEERSSIQALISANRKYVALVASMYQGRGKSSDELVEAGNRGLENAAKKYIPGQGFSFIAYAVWYVRQAIEDCIGENHIGS